MMRRLTPLTSPIHAAVNDDSLIVLGYEMIQVFCVHCGGLKNGILLFVPGMQLQEYDVKRALLDTHARCLCIRREEGK